MKDILHRNVCRHLREHHPAPHMVLMIILACLSLNVTRSLAQQRKLTAFTPVFSTQRIDSLQIVAASKHQTLQIGTQAFQWGLRTYPNSQITYVLDDAFATLDTWIGSLSEMESPGAKAPIKFEDQTKAEKPAKVAGVIFRVYGDGNKLYDSGILHDSTARHIRVDIRGIQELRLVIRDATTGIDPNHSKNNVPMAWANPVLLPGKPASLSRSGPAAYVVHGGHTTVKLDAEGKIVGINGAGQHQFLPLHGQTRLVQCKVLKLLSVKKLPDGGLSFTHLVADPKGNRCYVTDQFTGTPTSVRWTVTIAGVTVKPWSTAIISSIQWPVTDSSRFWTAWASPEMLGQGYWDNNVLKTQWRDPLQMMPFANSSRWFGGNPIMDMPTSGDLFSIPIATISDPRDTFGLSLVQSPEDTLLYMKLVTTRDGQIAFQRSHYRISPQREVRFHLDIVNHAKGWRGGLGWMESRYADYFEPPDPLAYDLSGCGAYSSYEGALDTARYKQMAFKFNWKASFDFPYMGMFMPPVKNWQTFATPEEATVDPWAQSPYKGKPTSRKELEHYSGLMRSEGFYVLNYFNVTEFGARVGDRQDIRTDLGRGNLWKDCTSFLYGKIADGILLNEYNQKDYYRTWGNAVVMDPGAHDYQQFLLEQAKRTLQFLPSSAGICIDRMDWLRFFNTRADDGVSWFNGAPARSLYLSWRSLMSRLGPLMHQHHKVIFGNPLVSMRLDMMRQLDGIYSEHNELGPGLNSSVFLGLDKPVTAWTWNSASLRPDPDFYFQRFLYLGVFPTAPLPYNNHTVRPGEFADSCYLAYGPLFQSMMRRRWVLEPNVATVRNSAAKINIFRVPRGYVLPVILGKEKNGIAEIVINTKNLSMRSTDDITVLQPGIPDAVSLKTVKKEQDKLVLRVPLRHGCAVLRILNK